MKSLYPELAPFQTFWLDTGGRHRIYVERSGNPDGIPVIFLHGGPCSGSRPDHRRFFDPAWYHIILFDQRGCGRSLPYGEIEANNTQALIDDMERIRRHLRLDHWLLFGGSWGGALALLYAQQHADRVLGLIIRGVFLARRKDLTWFLSDGAGRIYPEQWQRLAACIPEVFARDPVAGLYRALWHDEEALCLQAAREWDAWAAQVALGAAYQRDDGDCDEQKLLQRTRMELHYAVHGYFIEENRILENCHKIRHIPTIIIHGRNDLVCPPEAGFMLHRALPDAEFVLLAKAGHIAQGDAMIDALVRATDKMVERLAAAVMPVDAKI